MCGDNNNQPQLVWTFHHAGHLMAIIRHRMSRKINFFQHLWIIDQCMTWTCEIITMCVVYNISHWIFSVLHRNYFISIYHQCLIYTTLHVNVIKKSNNYYFPTIFWKKMLILVMSFAASLKDALKRIHCPYKLYDLTNQPQPPRSTPSVHPLGPLPLSKKFTMCQVR